VDDMKDIGQLPCAMAARNPSGWPVARVACCLHYEEHRNAPSCAPQLLCLQWIHILTGVRHSGGI